MHFFTGYWINKCTGKHHKSRSNLLPNSFPEWTRHVWQSLQADQEMFRTLSQSFFSYDCTRSNLKDNSGKTGPQDEESHTMHNDCTPLDDAAWWLKNKRCMCLKANSKLICVSNAQAVYFYPNGTDKQACWTCLMNSYFIKRPQSHNLPLGIAYIILTYQVSEFATNRFQFVGLVDLYCKSILIPFMITEITVLTVNILVPTISVWIEKKFQLHDLNVEELSKRYEVRYGRTVVLVQVLILKACFKKWQPRRMRHLELIDINGHEWLGLLRHVMMCKINFNLKSQEWAKWKAMVMTWSWFFGIIKRQSH